MTTQVPPGPENAVAPQDYPQFTTGYAMYPPPQPQYPAVSYPQEGATGYPVPVPYPQPGAPQQAHPQQAHPQQGHPQQGYSQPGGPQQAYPTAPPWAAAPPAPVAAPEQPLPQYGGLLVPFPEAMQHASRAQAPAVWPVAAFTLLFGVLGAISAKRRADQARRTRNSTAPYWITFLVSMAAGTFCWFVLSAVVVTPIVTEVQESSRLEAVQRNVVGDGQLKDARINATAAQCRAITERDAAGERDYLCRLTLDDGHTASLTVTADASGQWHAAPGR